MLADLASRGGGSGIGQYHDRSADPYHRSGRQGVEGLFSLRSGSEAVAYYLVAAGALWAREDVEVVVRSTIQLPQA